MTVVFSEQDCGCYVDGAFGDGHLLTILSDLVESLGAPHALVRSLSKLECPEENDDALLEAINFLQEHTESGCIWMLEAGDLILTSEDQL